MKRLVHQDCIRKKEAEVFLYNHSYSNSRIKWELGEDIVIYSVLKYGGDKEFRWSFKSKAYKNIYKAFFLASIRFKILYLLSKIIK